MLKTLFIIVTLLFVLVQARGGGVDSEYLNISEFETIQTGKSDLICIARDQQWLSRILDNKSHFVVAVKSYDADIKSSNGFKVSLVDENGNSLSDTRFGIYPGESFNFEDERKYHRFAVTLPDNPDSLRKLEQWCFKIELEPVSKNEVYIQASAELRMELNHTVK